MIDCPAHLARLRQRNPLVHNIANHVSMNVMANALLAIGAAPAMAHAREEVEEFAALADALSVNIGTLSGEWAESMRLAARAANEAGTPWAFDPVAVGATAFRRRVGAELVELNPRVIRGNASEIIALASASGGGRGVDSTDSVEAAERAALELAGRTGGVVAVSGPVDFVTDGRRRARIANGHPMMPRITVMGCTQTGVIAAFLAGADDVFEATAAAMACYAVAGELAGEHARGPGSFSVAFLDALYHLNDAQLHARLRLELDDDL